MFPEKAAKVIFHIVAVLQLSQCSTVFSSGPVLARKQLYEDLSFYVENLNLTVTEKSLRTRPAAEGGFCLRQFSLILLVRCVGSEQACISWVKLLLS